MPDIGASGQSGYAEKTNITGLNGGSSAQARHITLVEPVSSIVVPGG